MDPDYHVFDHEKRGNHQRKISFAVGDRSNNLPCDHLTTDSLFLHCLTSDDIVLDYPAFFPEYHAKKTWLFNSFKEVANGEARW